MSARLFKNVDVLKNNGFMNTWFRNRVINKNQNVILAFTGATGSGKTYNCLSCAEAWYNEQFNEEYSEDNICFSLSEVILRINNLKKDNKLRKGETLILEEAGANFGNLDFQNKMSKMFSYILQSFRSMNIILLMTVPVLTMINKNARQLIHGHFITSGIDYNLKIAKVKPYFHQLNQSSGKSYWKYPRVKVLGKIITLERITFKIPSNKLIELYEIKKERFVVGLTDEFIRETMNNEKKKVLQDVKKELTPNEQGVYKRLEEGWSKQMIADERGCSMQNVEYYISNMYKKGWDIHKLLQIAKNQITKHSNDPTQ